MSSRGIGIITGADVRKDPTIAISTAVSKTAIHIAKTWTASPPALTEPLQPQSSAEQDF